MNTFKNKLSLILLLILFSTLALNAQPNFTRYTKGNPIVPKGVLMDWDDSAVFWPNVIVVNDTFYMTYIGTRNFPSLPLAIGLATSTDGLSFTKHAEPILTHSNNGFDSYSVSGSVLYYDNSVWYLYYGGVSTETIQPAKVIGKTTSATPHGPWTRTNDTLITVGENGTWDDEFVGVLSIISTDSSLVMYYWGGDVWPQPLAQIGMATSSDNGATWEKYSGNPILSPGPESYDNISIFGASIIKSNNNWEMFYAGKNTKNYSICYATSLDGINWTKQGVVLAPTGDPLAIYNEYEGPSIIKKGSQYYLYYDYGINANGIGVAIGERSATLKEVPFEFNTIQGAIEAAVNGDTVLVSEGTYFENINFKGKAITVASRFILDQDTSHISKTIIDGSQPNYPDRGSVVTFNSGEDTNSVICGFTISGGSGTTFADGEKGGGGIFSSFSSPSITHNKIKNNYVFNDKTKNTYGGGIYAGPVGANTFVIIKDNFIEFNKVEAKNRLAFGGGICVSSNGIIQRNKINNNEVKFSGSSSIEYSWSFGGGISCYSQTTFRTISIRDNIITNNLSKSTNHSYSGGVDLIWINSDFTGNVISNNLVNGKNWNHACGMRILFSEDVSYIKNNLFSFNKSIGEANTSGGGLLVVYTEGLTVNKNRFKNNESFVGAGIFLDRDSNTKIKNNLIVFNKAEFAAGGISVIGSSNHEITNNTIVENTAQFGGGLYFLMNSNPVIMNTIIYGNSADSSGNQICFGDTVSHPTFNYCDIEGGKDDFGFGVDVGSYSGFYINNIDSDPLFFDADSFFLSATSPCLDMGNPDQAYNDKDGTRNDMGCYGGPDSIITAVEDNLSNNKLIPNGFKLFQNYPNPFNPTTVIKYQITNKTHPLIPSREGKERSDRGVLITLKVYDILGREVTALVNKKQKPGGYKVEWNATNQPSGVYFYKIQAGNFIETKKMILLQ